ncbi:hypothetical protein ONE63_011507 [Megalurothrips usitatus]|uniref:DUF4371 domain-containing protein n=1 Tax=Megalurothrips usitatus TaxID=439358 RepID=A0AAV7X2V4_9NEOP|nr:hypothetical protein ONE63_011507 [Megalurothrips usitatus]
MGNSASLSLFLFGFPSSNSDVSTGVSLPEPEVVAAVSDSEPELSASSSSVFPPKDMVHYVGRALSQEEKADILESAWQPDIKFKFPSSGGFAIVQSKTAPIVFGARSFQPIQGVERAVTSSQVSSSTPSSATGKTQKKYLIAIKLPASILTHGSLQQTSLPLLRVDENRRKIKPIIETVIFFGREGLPLRGIKETSDLSNSEESDKGMSVEGDGKFRALLRFKPNSNDADLADHLKSAAANAKYTSPEIQNEVIICCTNIVIQQLVEEINAAKGFSVLADETSDAAKIEQLAICIRCLKEDTVKEVFLIFVPVTDCRGTALADVIINTIVNIGIDITYMFGQGYDVITGLEILEPINAALENVISNLTDKDAIASAAALQKSITDGGYLVTLYVVLTAGRESKLAAAENNSLRRIAGPVWHEGLQKMVSRPNAEVRELLGISPGLNLAKKRALQYAGHVARGSVPPNALAMLVAPPPAKRFRGGPRKSLAKQRADNAAAVGIPPATWREAAEDRDAFRAATKIFDTLPDPHEERRQSAKDRRAAREQPHQDAPGGGP